MVLLLSACITDEVEVPVESVHVGDYVPDFSLVMADGTLFTVQSMTGKVWMLVFFSIHCGDCQALMPQIDAFHRREPRIPVICVSRDLVEDGVAAYVMAEGLTVDYAVPHDPAVYHLFATSGVPRVYVIDGSGSISASFCDSPLPAIADIEAALRQSSTNRLPSGK